MVADPSVPLQSESQPSNAAISVGGVPWVGWLVALLFGASAFLLFTRHNDFPFYYHTDEASKVRQVMTGTRNFHHPLLLLKSTEACLALTGGALAYQSVVEAGRTVSAFYAALAVAALVLLAWRRGGAVAGVLAGILLTTHPVIYELAHYMKEDCSLLAGVALCFLCLDFYLQRPTLVRAAFAGAAAGFATSGKLAGLAPALLAFLAILAVPRRGRRGDWRVALIFLGAALLSFGIINSDALQQWAGVRRGWNNEITRIDENSLNREGKLKIKYLSTFGRQISVPLLLGALFWIFRRWRERRTQSLATWVLISFPLLSVALLSVAPVTKERYLLPVFALFCVLGSWGIAELARTRPFRHSLPAAWALAILAIAWHLPLLVRYEQEFSGDDRRELIAWIREHVPADAVIAHDRRARFDYSQKFGLPIDQIPQKTRRPKRYLSEFGTLEEVRERGTHYLVLCEPDYHSLLRPTGKLDSKSKAARRFYERVRSEARLLWERPGGRLLYLHPGLELYEIPEPPASGDAA